MIPQIISKVILQLRHSYLAMFFLLIACLFSPAIGYDILSNFSPTDEFILTEFDRFGGPNIVNYPMCIFPEEDGIEIKDPNGVLKHMETVVNTWLPFLYNRWGFGVYSVSFELKATSEAGCAEKYNGFRPFSVTTYVGNAYGGNLRTIRIRFPGKTISAFSDGKSRRQVILHEVGHVFGLGHTQDQSPISVMDYGDMYNMNGIGGDDIIALTHVWKFLKGYVKRSECEFGYSGSSSCNPSGEDIQNKQIVQNLIDECIEANESDSNKTLIANTCTNLENQLFTFHPVDNGWQLKLSETNLCFGTKEISSDGVFTQTACDTSSLNQQFTLSPNSDGSYLIRNEFSGKVIHLNNGTLEQSTPTEKTNHAWSIKEPITTFTSNTSEHFQKSENFQSRFIPTNTIVTFQYQIQPGAESQGMQLKIFDLMGQNIRSLDVEFKTPGRHTLLWDGKNSFANVIPSGKYYFQLKDSKNNLSPIRIMLMR